MRIQTFLHLILSAFVVAAILVAAVFIGERWESYASNRRLLASIDIYSSALKAAEKLSFERGPVNSVLGSGPPVPPDYLAKLADARVQTDAAVSALRLMTVSLPDEEGRQTVSDLDNLGTSLAAARQETDRLALLSKADRESGAISQVVNHMFSIVDQNAFMINRLELDIPRYNPMIVQLVSAARQAADLREYAGRIGSTLAAPITEGRPYSEVESLGAERIYGRLNTLIEQLEFICDHLPQEKELSDALAAMQRSYMHQGIPLVGRLVAAARADGRYDMSMGDFTGAYVPTMKSILLLRDAALASARSKSVDARSLSLIYLVLCVTAMIALTGMVAGLSIFFSRYYVRPLVDMTTDIQHLAAGNQELTPRIYNRTDEIGNLSVALRQLIDLAVVSESVMKKLVEEKASATKASEDKSRFLAHMSHELRTPLNAIIGFSDLMRSQAGAGMVAKFAEYAGDIHDSAHHLLLLITDILDISKIEAGKMELSVEEIDIAEMARECIRLMAIRAAAGQVSIGTDFAPDLPRLSSDIRRLKQALLNLVSNAVKFTGPGGTVTISAARAGDGSVSIRVRDTGIGMSADELRKALEPYGQIRDLMSTSREGTGLGLPLCKLLVEHLGGTLSLQSTPHEGTIAIIEMPVKSPRTGA